MKDLIKMRDQIKIPHVHRQGEHRISVIIQECKRSQLGLLSWGLRRWPLILYAQTVRLASQICQQIGLAKLVIKKSICKGTYDKQLGSQLAIAYQQMANQNQLLASQLAFPAIYHHISSLLNDDILEQIYILSEHHTDVKLFNLFVT